MIKVIFRSKALIVGIGLVLVAMVLRVVVSGHQEYTTASKFEHHGDADSAIVHYRRAARWYLPFSPYPGRALQRLEHIALQYKASRDVHGALAAYRGMRAAIMSTRSFYTPHRDALERANQNIASLMAALPPIPEDANKSKKQRRDEYLQGLEEAAGPSVFWAFILLTGFVMWVGGAFTFFSRAFDEKQRLKKREALRWGFVTALGAIFFLVGAGLA